jgi:hypothetical protein
MMFLKERLWLRSKIEELYIYNLILPFCHASLRGCGLDFGLVQDGPVKNDKQ